MRLYDIEMTPSEFIWKTIIILVLVVPICVGGTAFVFHSLFPALNFLVVVCLTAIGAIIGTIAALFITSIIIKIGHKS